jgi:hypothetical protein
VVARDLDSFAQFARNTLLNLPNVKDMQTSFSLGEIKSSHALPLSQLGPMAGQGLPGQQEKAGAKGP